MHFVGLLFFVAITIKAEEKCENLLNGYYEELDCKPVKNGSDKCPTSFDCSEWENRNKEKCYFEGKQYAKKAKVPTPDNSCTAGCYCKPSDPSGAEIVCANNECPEGMSPSQYKDFIIQNDFQHCCATNIIRNQEKIKKMADTCTYNNKSYKSGQKFYPKEASSCKKCICQSGFKGEVEEPFCQEIKCHLLLHYGPRINRGCAPVFLLISPCCPIEWKCPEASDKVTKGDTKGVSKSEKQCKFGTLTLSVGDKLQQSDGSMDCQCRTPSMITCTKDKF